MPSLPSFLHTKSQSKIPQISMGYIALDLDSSFTSKWFNHNACEKCYILFPWNKYSYKRLPMGILGSPSHGLNKNVNLTSILECEKVYLDKL